MCGKLRKRFWLCTSPISHVWIFFMCTHMCVFVSFCFEFVFVLFCFVFVFWSSWKATTSIFQILPNPALVHTGDQNHHLWIKWNHLWLTLGIKLKMSSSRLSLLLLWCQWQSWWWECWAQPCSGSHWGSSGIIVCHKVVWHWRLHHGCHY